jgi:hypothetical protein
MAGLFDLLTSKDPTVANGLLQMGLSLLSSKGNFANALGQAGMAGLQGANQYKQQQFQRQLQQSQMDEAQRRKAMYEREDQLAKLPGQFIVPPSTPGVDATGGMETALEAPQNQASPQGRMDMPALAQAFMRAPGGLDKGLALQQALQKTAPQLHAWKPGDVVGTYENGKINPLLSIPDKADKPDPNKPFYVVDGKIVPNPEYQKYAKELARSGASNVSVKVDNKLGEGLAKEVGPMVADSATMAKGAQQAIANAESIIKAIDSNKVIAGPGATLRLRGAQIGQMLGVTGKDVNETITNTRSLIQGLAQSTVAARSALKGQGQVSDFEGRLLEKAASGNIDDMTVEEIRAVVNVNKRLAQKQLSNHGELIGKLKSRDATSGIADLFDVPTNNPVRTYNPVTGKIE